MYHAYLYAVDKALTIQYSDGNTAFLEEIPFDQLTTKQDLIDRCTLKVNLLNTDQTKKDTLISTLQSLIGKQII